jgi:hypothetical protein
MRSVKACEAVAYMHSASQCELPIQKKHQSLVQEYNTYF